MKSTRVVLFMFHREFLTCAARLSALRRLNPGVPVHAVFGGENADVEAARSTVGALVDSFIVLNEQSPRWRWKNTDLQVREWFRREGHRRDFERVHVVQWDLLLLAPLHVLDVGPEHGIVLSGLVPLEEVLSRWYWVNQEAERSGTYEQLERVRRAYPHVGPPFASLGPGTVLSRAFLEAYSCADVSDAGHDEIRLPLWAQALRFPLSDTHFYPRWFEPEVERCFNADAVEIRPEVVEAELGLPAGRRAFHPCRESFSPEVVERLVNISERRSLGAQAGGRGGESEARAPDWSGPPVRNRPLEGNPLVSVVVTTFQHAPWIARALEGVLAQRVDFEFEVVVGEDCSTDGTREIVRSFSERWPHLFKLVLPDRNLGLHGGPLFMRVLEQARGRYFAYLDGDDFWSHPEKLARQVSLMEDDDSLSICFHDVDVVDAQGQLLPGRYVPSGLPRRVSVDRLCDTNFIPSCSAVVRAAALRELPDWVGGQSFGD
ncbi:MAG: glycosyltransferase family 2 protein, partial [Myxococcota bacterium]